MNNTISSERKSDEYLILNSCGTQYFKYKYAYCNRQSGRIDYHILYISQGYCTIIVDQKEIKVPEGHIILFRPFEKQNYYFSSDDDSVSMYLHFTGTACETIVNSINMGTGKVFNIRKNTYFEDCFYKLEREYYLNQVNSKMFCSSYLMLLLSIIGRALSNDCRDISYEHRIRKSCSTIYSHFNEKIEINTLANEHNLSVSRFSHIFKETTGFSPIEMQIRIRIEKAKELLKFTDNSISEIALAIGYDSQSYFTKIFKKHTDLSPMEYRKNKM